MSKQGNCGAIFRKAQQLNNEMTARGLSERTPEQMAEAMLACGRERDQAELVQELTALQNVLQGAGSMPWDANRLLSELLALLPDKQQQKSVLAQILGCCGDERAQEDLEQLEVEALIGDILDRLDKAERSMYEELNAAMEGLELEQERIEGLSGVDPLLVAGVLGWAQEDGDLPMDGEPLEQFALEAAAIQEAACQAKKTGDWSHWRKILGRTMAVALLALVIFSVVASSGVGLAATSAAAAGSGVNFSAVWAVMLGKKTVAGTFLPMLITLSRSVLGGSALAWFVADKFTEGSAKELDSSLNQCYERLHGRMERDSARQADQAPRTAQAPLPQQA